MMELMATLRILERRKWLILVTVLITVLVAAVGRLQVPVNYKATAVVRILPYPPGTPSYTQLTYADRIMKTYVEIGSSSLILSKIRDSMGLSAAEPEGIEIQIVPDTELLTITVEDQDAVLARDVANELALYLVADNEMREVRANVVELASIPEPPSRLRIFLFYFLAVVVGLVSGLGVAFLVESFDPRLDTEEQISHITGLPVLGRIPEANRTKRDKFLSGDFSCHDAFRRLSTSIAAMLQEKEIRTIVVTSAEIAEGKSTVAASLGCCLSQSGRRVVILDVDLHRSMLHTFFELPNNIGLYNLLQETIPLEEVLFETRIPGLWVIPSGSLPEQSTELLFNRDRMKAVFEQLRERFDFVIVDTPAFLGVSDTLVVASAADGVLLVVRPGTARQAALRVTFQELASIQVKILGLVVNHVKDVSPVAYARYYRSIQRERLAGEMGRASSAATVQLQPGELAKGAVKEGKV